MPLNVEQMFAEAQRLPEKMPELSAYGQAPIATEGQRLSPHARALTEAFKPLIEKAEVGKHMVGRPDFAKRFEATTKLVLAQMLRNQYGTTPAQWHKEATFAGTDIPSYARQTIAMILRAFPQMFTLQLFPVTPFSGPDGRVYFKTTQYNSAYTTGGSPTIASADRLDDLTKFNKGYAQVDQGVVSRKLKIIIDSITASVKSYRLDSEWTYEAEDDMAALYGETLESSLVRDMSHLIAWTTDRTMIDAAVTDANSTQSWTATPSGYSSLSYSDQKTYDESIWSQGILKLITKIQQKRVFNTTPDWFIVGTTLSERIQRLNSFVPFANGQGDQLQFNKGALRDIGTLTAIGLRVMVDPMLAVDTGLMGYRPTSSFDPAIHYGPYKPIRVTGTLETPSIGTYDKGVYSRFAVVRKDTGTAASSSQLADAYGVFTVV